MAKEKNKTELPTVMEGELTARLIKLREDAGFDISQMADAMCLSEETIVNLENEAFDLLAEPPYVRGYLRNYAKLGEEDPEELISRYESLRGADASELDFAIKSSSTIVPTATKRISPIWGQVILLACLIGGIWLLTSIPGVKSWIDNTWASFSTQVQPSDSTNNPSLLGELPVPVPLPEDESGLSAQESNISTPTSNQTSDSTQTNTDKAENTDNTSTDLALNTETSSEETTTEATTTSSSDDKTPVTDSETVAETNTATADSVIPASQQMIDIKLVFNKEVWLRIKDKENKTVFEGLNKAETDKSITLEKPLTFRVGNAQGLSLFIDGKAVDISSYINGSIANFTLE